MIGVERRRASLFRGGGTRASSRDRDHWPDLDDRRRSAAIHADYGLTR
jgi:hypothetical protein